MCKFRFQNQIVLTFFLSICAIQFAFAEQSTPSAPPTSSQAAERDADWKQFKSVEGRFSIVFPGLPRESTQSLPGPGITFELHLHQLTTPVAEYSVMYADYPESISDRKAEVAKAVLDNGLEGPVASMNSKLLSVEEISIDGHPGKLYSEQMPKGDILRGKSFLVGSRLYQIAITTPKEDGAEAETVRAYKTTATKFLDSFRLVESK